MTRIDELLDDIHHHRFREQLNWLKDFLENLYLEASAYEYKSTGESDDIKDFIEYIWY